MVPFAGEGLGGPGKRYKERAVATWGGTSYHCHFLVSSSSVSLLSNNPIITTVEHHGRYP
jgi:hypothetical protein